MLYTLCGINEQAASNPYIQSMASIPAMAAASAYGSYPLTLIPGLMSTAEQLTNYGVMTAPPALMKSPQRTDRLEVSICV
jgi:hypothetical protein